MALWDPAGIAAGTADAAFVSDENGVIVGWNDAAVGLLGHSAEEAVGRPCHEILCGLDTFGNRYCNEDCAITKMAGRGEPARVFVLHVRHASGRLIPLRVSAARLPKPESEGFLILHILLPTELVGAPGQGGTDTLEREGDRSGPGVGSEEDKLRSLTPREVEVLRLLASGNASQDIATELFISLTTVRTHIQNILKKLDVHSQLEAVALAFRRGLL